MLPPPPPSRHKASFVNANKARSSKVTLPLPPPPPANTILPQMKQRLDTFSDPPPPPPPITIEKIPPPSKDRASYVKS